MRLERLILREWWRRVDWVEVGLVALLVASYAGYRVASLLAGSP